MMSADKLAGTDRRVPPPATYFWKCLTARSSAANPPSRPARLLASMRPDYPEARALDSDRTASGMITPAWIELQRLKQPKHSR